MNEKRRSFYGKQENNESWRENEIESYYKKTLLSSREKKVWERNVEEEENQQVRLVPFVFEVCTCCLFVCFLFIQNVFFDDDLKQSLKKIYFVFYIENI